MIGRMTDTCISVNAHHGLNNTHKSTMQEVYTATYLYTGCDTQSHQALSLTYHAMNHESTNKNVMVTFSGYHNIRLECFTANVTPCSPIEPLQVLRRTVVFCGRHAYGHQYRTGNGKLATRFALLHAALLQVLWHRTLFFFFLAEG